MLARADKQRKERQTEYPVWYSGASLARNKNGAIMPPTMQGIQQTHQTEGDFNTLFPKPICHAVPTLLLKCPLT